MPKEDMCIKAFIRLLAARLSAEPNDNSFGSYV